jgi:hypothetical protein
MMWSTVLGEARKIECLPVLKYRHINITGIFIFFKIDAKCAQKSKIFSKIRYFELSGKFRENVRYFC